MQTFNNNNYDDDDTIIIIIMENVAVIPLKKTSDLDLVKAFKVAISTQYGNLDDKTRESLESLNEMRKNVVDKFGGETRREREMCLEALQK